MYFDKLRYGAFGSLSPVAEWFSDNRLRTSMSGVTGVGKLEVSNTGILFCIK